MNLHPAFVHFPIALLFLYALVEILPLRRWMPSAAWDSVRVVLLYTGTAASIATAITGLMAADIVGETPAVSAHEAAALTLVGIAIITSLVSYFRRTDSSASRYALKALAAAILVLLFVVGSLGANIVYGSQVDPLVTFVTSVFVR